MLRRSRPWSVVLLFVAVAVVWLASTTADRQRPVSSAEQLPAIDRMVTFGTSGKAVYPFTAGHKTEATLFEHEGAGCLTHMWFGGNWKNYERLRIRIYVDGE